MLKKRIWIERLKKNKNKIEFKDVLNQRLFFIEKETDSSYQVGSFGVLSPSKPGNIKGWKKIEKDTFIVLFRGGDEFYQRKMKIDKVEGNKIYVKDSDDRKIRYTIGVEGLENKVLSIKEESDYDSYRAKSETWYALKENDIDSAYIFNNYKEKERLQLIGEYGNNYKEMISNNEIDAYQHTSDSIYMKYMMKDCYSYGTFIEDGCEFIINEKVTNKNGVYRFINEEKNIFLYNDYNFSKELIKYIYKDGNEYVVVSDILPKENNNEDYSNMVLKDRILHITSVNNNWIATESIGTEIEYKNLPVFYVNAKSGLNVRSKPLINGEKIMKLNYKEKVYVTDTLQLETIGKVKGNWLEIQFPGVKGYVFGPYVSEK
ncbi:SH3 domain-containing protein [uncultured Tenacibaculum sp.]|uniref:SH3 domain-containing protein n=1 Tax=uncultured Tenacibaculum sp. TaxID=174713 RepID=UPI002614B896|nr:SH3 domain-containing protein [uncultured Tenacibaculum sp.]